MRSRHSLLIIIALTVLRGSLSTRENGFNAKVKIDNKNTAAQKGKEVVNDRKPGQILNNLVMAKVPQSPADFMGVPHHFGNPMEHGHGPMIVHHFGNPMEHGHGPMIRPQPLLHPMEPVYGPMLKVNHNVHTTEVNTMNIIHPPVLVSKKVLTKEAPQLDFNENRQVTGQQIAKEIQAKYPGMAFQGEVLGAKYRNKSVEPRKPSPAVFKYFTNIPLTEKELPEVTTEVIRKIRLHGLADLVDGATKSQPMSDFLNTIPDALASIGDGTDGPRVALEKRLLNFLSSFKHLFLQLKATAKSRLTGKTIALIDEPNFDMLLDTYTAYLQSHDEFCRPEEVAHLDYCTVHDKALSELLVGLMAYAGENGIRKNYQRVKVRETVMVAPGLKTILDQGLKSTQTLHGSAQADVVAKIFMTISDIIGTPQGYDLAEGLKDVANFLSAFSQRAVTNMTLRKLPVVRAWGMKEEQKQEALRKLSNLIKKITFMSGKGSFVDQAMGSISTNLGRLKQYVAEDFVGPAPEKQERKEAPLALKEEPVLMAAPEITKKHQKPTTVHLVAATQEELEAKKKALKEEWAAEQAAEEEAQRIREKKAEMLYRFQQTSNNIISLLEAIGGRGTSVDKFTSIRIFSEFLRRVYRAIRTQTVLLEAYTPFEEFFPAADALIEAMHIYIMTGQSGRFTFLRWDKDGIHNFAAALKRFVFSFTNTRLEGKALAGFIDSHKKFEVFLKRLPQLEGYLIEGVTPEDLSHYDAKYTYDVARRRFVEKSANLVITDKVKEVTVVPAKIKAFKRQFAEKHWSRMIRNGQRVTYGLKDLVAKFKPQLERSGVNLEAIPTLVNALAKPTLKAPNPAKKVSGRLVITGDQMQAIMEGLTQVEDGLTKIEDPKSTSGLPEQLEEVEDAIDMLHSGVRSLFFDGKDYNEFKEPAEVSIYFPGCTQSTAGQFTCEQINDQLEAIKTIINDDLALMDKLAAENHPIVHSRVFPAVRKYLVHAKKILETPSLPANVVVSTAGLIRTLSSFWKSFATHSLPRPGQEPLDFVSLSGRLTTNFFFPNSRFLNAFGIPNTSGLDQAEEETYLNPLRDAALELQELITIDMYTSGEEFVLFPENVDPADVARADPKLAKIDPEEVLNEFNDRLSLYHRISDEMPREWEPKQPNLPTEDPTGYLDDIPVGVLAYVDDVQDTTNPLADEEPMDLLKVTGEEPEDAVDDITFEDEPGTPLDISQDMLEVTQDNIVVANDDLPDVLPELTPKKSQEEPVRPSDAQIKEELLDEDLQDENDSGSLETSKEEEPQDFAQKDLKESKVGGTIAKRRKTVKKPEETVQPTPEEPQEDEQPTDLGQTMDFSSKNLPNLGGQFKRFVRKQGDKPDAPLPEETGKRFVRRQGEDAPSDAKKHTEESKLMDLDVIPKRKGDPTADVKPQPTDEPEEDALVRAKKLAQSQVSNGSWAGVKLNPMEADKEVNGDAGKMIEPQMPRKAKPGFSGFFIKGKMPQQKEVDESVIEPSRLQTHSSVELEDEAVSTRSLPKPTQMMGVDAQTLADAIGEIKRWEQPRPIADNHLPALLGGDGHDNLDVASSRHLPTGLPEHNGLLLGRPDGHDDWRQEEGKPTPTKEGDHPHNQGQAGPIVADSPTKVTKRVKKITRVFMIEVLKCSKCPQDRLLGPAIEERTLA